MALKTYSAFYYGFEVNEFNYTLAFDEGSGTLTAEIDVGLYSAEQLASAVARALNETGVNEYSVSFDRVTRIYTIVSDVAFEILGATGGDAGTTILPTLGFSLVDTASLLSHTGASSAGTSYSPQFYLQNYIASNHWQKAAFAQVNKSASGRVQVQQFGTERFMQCNIKWITEIHQGDGPIRSNPDSVSQVEDFLTWIVRKAPIEFMPDENDKETFETFILESAPEFNDGTGFKLRELYDQGLPYYYETGNLRFRKVDT